MARLNLLMQQRFLRLLYNLLFPIAFLFFLPFYLPRMLRRGGYRNNFFQRLGFFDQATIARIGKKRLWLHAVSVGEIFIALKFIKQFQQRNPNAKFILSTTTTTGLEIAQQHASPSLEPIANPIDFFPISYHSINLFQPAALIMVEGDVWPERLLLCKKKKIPTAIITARLSPRSEARFQKFRKMIAPIFNTIDLMTLPSQHDQERWLALGSDPQRLRVVGNIKFDQQQTGVRVRFLIKPESLVAENISFYQESNPDPIFAEAFFALGWDKNDPVLLGGSLHAGEEEVLLEAWLQLRNRFPRLRLIVAPRHVERRNEILALFTKHNITAILRSEKLAPPFSDVFILDTTGELNSWYAVATVVFMGKSLGLGNACGGQNPVEPLALGRPVLVGPSMEKFEPLISELRKANGVITVSNAEEIAMATEKLLLDPEAASNIVARGLQTLEQHQGATERTCVLIEELIAGKF